MLSQADFEAFLADETKVIEGDIRWEEDEDHSPSVEFRVELNSDPGYPIVVRGSYNPLARALSFTVIHRSMGRIYALDLGKDHRNPDGARVGEKHKHRWKEGLRDREAYVPGDITAAATAPVDVWEQFCAEAKIDHRGRLSPPPPVQEELI